MEEEHGERSDWLLANGYQSYRDYTRSSRWTRRRRSYYDRHPKTCWICSATEGIVLHHRTYETIGSEPDEDLIPLCSVCHSLVHWKALPGGIGDRCIYIRLLIEREGMTGYARLRGRHARAQRKAATKGITNRQAKLLARLQRWAGESYSGAGMTSKRARSEIMRLERQIGARAKPTANVGQRAKVDLPLRMITSGQRAAFARHRVPVPSGITARQARIALARLEAEAAATRRRGAI
jgi:hypothetical protein